MSGSNNYSNGFPSFCQGIVQPLTGQNNAPYSALRQNQLLLWNSVSAVTAVQVDIPATALTNTGFWVTGSTTGGPSRGVTVNLGAGNVPTQNFGTDLFGNYSVFVPGPVSNGTYTVTVTDIASSVAGNCGPNFVVSAYNPFALASPCLWFHDPNDPLASLLQAITGTTSAGWIAAAMLNRAGNGGQYLTPIYGQQPPPNPVLLGRGVGSLSKNRCWVHTLASSSVVLDATSSGWLAGPMSVVQAPGSFATIPVPGANPLTLGD